MRVPNRKMILDWLQQSRLSLLADPIVSRHSAYSVFRRVRRRGHKDCAHYQTMALSGPTIYQGCLATRIPIPTCASGWVEPPFTAINRYMECKAGAIWRLRQCVYRIHIRCSDFFLRQYNYYASYYAGTFGTGVFRWKKYSFVPLITLSHRNGFFTDTNGRS